MAAGMLMISTQSMQGYDIGDPVTFLRRKKILFVAHLPQKDPLN